MNIQFSPLGYKYMSFGFLRMMITITHCFMGNVSRIAGPTKTNTEKIDPILRFTKVIGRFSFLNIKLFVTIQGFNGLG